MIVRELRLKEGRFRDDFDGDRLERCILLFSISHFLFNLAV